MTNRFFCNNSTTDHPIETKAVSVSYVFMGKEHGKDIYEPCWTLLTGRAGEPGVYSVMCTKEKFGWPTIMAKIKINVSGVFLY